MTTTRHNVKPLAKPPIVRRVYYQAHPTRTDGSTVFRVLRLPEGAVLILFDLNCAAAWALATAALCVMLLLALGAVPR